MDIEIVVIGLENVNRYRAALARIEGDIKAYAQGMRAPFEQTLRAVIGHVVYDAYAPKEYKRTGGLIEAVASQYNGGTFSLGPVTQVAELEFYNDPSKVTLRDDPFSAGGSRKEDVPLEIEEGRYPRGRGGRGWGGPTVPRPAFALFGQQIAPEIHVALINIVSKALLA